MEEAQNIQKGQNFWYDLRDAGDITGLSVDTLRKRIKLGKCQGRKVRTVRGYKWQINIDSIEDSEELDTGLINRKAQKNLSSERVSDINNNTVSDILKEELITAKDRHISDLQNILTIFQQRIIVLESDRAILENRLKLLPAPPEVISEKLQELENIRNETDEVRQKLEQAEKKAVEAREAKERLSAELSAAKIVAEKELEEARRELEESRNLMEQLKNDTSGPKQSEVDYDTLSKIRQLETFNKKLQLNLDEKAKMLEHVNQKCITIQQAVRKTEEEKAALNSRLTELSAAEEERKTLEETLKEVRDEAERAREEAAQMEAEIALEVTRRGRLEEVNREREEELAKLELEKKALAKALEEERNKSFLTRLKELFTGSFGL